MSARFQSRSTAKKRRKTLEKLLTERSSKIGRRNGMGETLTRKLNFQQACDARDGLAKAAYRKIFDYLLLTLNAANEPDKIASKQNQIGILDIFGFERVLEGKKSVASFFVGTFFAVCFSLKKNGFSLERSGFSLEKSGFSLEVK